MNSPLGVIADVIAIVTAIAAIIGAWQSTKLRQQQKREQQRLEDRIKIILTCGGQQSLELPWSIRRRNLTRAEVLGLIGMLPIKPKTGEEGKQPRFKLEYLGTKAFMDQLDEVATGERGGALLISCTPEDIAQFDLTRIPHG